MFGPTNALAFARTPRTNRTGSCREVIVDLEHSRDTARRRACCRFDPYATQLAAELYRHLSTSHDPRPLAALSDARRELERRRRALPDQHPHARLAEWATPVLVTHGIQLPLYDPDAPAETVIIEGPPRALDPAVVVRTAGEFVGRRPELRAIKRSLRTTHHGVVIHGMGGVGKSTLAAAALLALPDDALLVSFAGPLIAESMLASIAQRYTMRPLADAAAKLRQVLEVMVNPEYPIEMRIGALAEVWPKGHPLVLLLDNFEDNLADDHRTIAGAGLENLIAAWLHHDSFRPPTRHDRRTAGGL